MNQWLADAANIATIAEAFIALAALGIAIIGLNAARQVWPTIRRMYSDSTHAERQTGTQVIGDNATLNVTQVIGQSATESDDEARSD